jgi:hypothetical protein
MAGRDAASVAGVDAALAIAPGCSVPRSLRLAARCISSLKRGRLSAISERLVWLANSLGRFRDAVHFPHRLPHDREVSALITD